MRGFFVTGTDTDCGKTRVACALIHALRAQEIEVAPFKPVAAGSEIIDGELRNRDALDLMAAAASTQSYDRVNPYCYAAPIAPHIAAAEVGEIIDFTQILTSANFLAKSSDLLLVEGAGGWLVPLGAERDMADLATALQLPVILVVGLRLGCLNHARLTEAVIAQSGLVLAGWVGTLLEPQMDKQRENIESLKMFLKAPCMGVLPHLSEAETGADYVNVAELISSL